MIKYFYITKLRKYLFFLIVLTVFYLPLGAQGILGKLKKTVQDVTEIAYQTAVLAKLAGMTTAEVNNTVRVIKGNEGNNSGVINGKVTKPKIKNGEFKNLSWEPITYFDNHLFPSCIISMATYTGELTGELKALSSPLGFRLKSKYANMPIKWEVECVDNKYFDKQAGEVVYTEADKDVFFMPDLGWKYTVLGKQLASEPVNITFRLFDGDGNKVEKVTPLYVRSINDCIFRYKDTKLDFLFTAYIQEEHPEIDKILKEALDTKIVNSILGYQANTEESVHKQVEAIWTVLHNRGFKYSSITETAGNSNYIYSQVVRTFDNAIKTSQANCIDGTVVFASILRKIGIHTVLVLTNNHCFLGYYTDDSRSKIAYLETTMLSNTDFIEVAKTAQDKKNAYMKQFLAARMVGIDNYKKNRANNNLFEIDVDKARNYVKPIPFN